MALCDGSNRLTDILQDRGLRLSLPRYRPTGAIARWNMVFSGHRDTNAGQNEKKTEGYGHPTVNTVSFVVVRSSLKCPANVEIITAFVE